MTGAMMAETLAQRRGLKTHRHHYTWKSHFPVPSTTKLQQIRMSIEALPAEILELVTAHLSTYDPPSLVNLALVNKAYFRWCKPFMNNLLFHDAHISVTAGNSVQDSHKFTKEVNNYIRKLEQKGTMAHVRRLVIDDYCCDKCEGNTFSHLHTIEDLRGDVPGQPYAPFYENLS
jgi:hypothetical protein